jgi:glutathione S-transferase
MTPNRAPDTVAFSIRSLRNAVMHRLYYSPGACSMAVHIVLDEIGEPFETELISSRGQHEGAETSTPAWLRTNPKGRIPALSGVPGRMGGADAVLTEVAAILFYLAATHPESGLLPKDAAAQARCLEWMNWLASNVHGMSYGQIWRVRRFSRDAAAFAGIEAKGRDNLVEQYDYIELLLGDGRDWAVPGGYSIVDPYLLVFYQWGQRIGFDMRTAYPAWSGLTGKLVERPAVRRVLQRENIAIT